MAFITTATTLIGTILAMNLFSYTPVTMVNAEIITYRVAMTPLMPTSTYPAFGFATIFADTDKSIIGYAGIASKLETDLTPSKCTASNGCGVRIHSGRSCANTTTQGGHYYNNVAVKKDPWTDEEYTTDKNGKANFQSILNIGTVDIEGRVFILRSRDGKRVACGVIQKVPSSEELLVAKTTNLTSARVNSNVLLYAVQPDTACYFGAARNLEPNLVSFMNKDKTLKGKNCNVANGCGVHIHNGTSCFNTTTQGGHYYNSVQYPVDPWLNTMYDMTDKDGNAYFTGCVQTGFEVSTFLKRPFVVHSNNGTRVSCGLLNKPAPAPVAAPVPAPVVAPVKAPVVAPVPAPVVAPVKAPVVAPVTAPVPAPVVTPVTAPVPAPVTAPVPAPVVAPVTAPVMAPMKISPDPPSSNITAPVVAPVISPTSNNNTAPVTAIPPVKAPVKAPVQAPFKSPVKAPVKPPVKPPVKKSCGLFGLNLFCPLTGCGFLGRLFGLC